MSETFEKPKGLKKKLENFWYHYKIAVMIGAFFLASITILAVDYLKKREPDMTLCYVSETYANEVQFKRIEDKFKEIIGDINGDGRETLVYSLMVIREKSISNYDVDKQQQFNYSFLHNSSRLYIIEDTFFMQKQDFFEPLEGVVAEEYLTDGLKNKEGEICAIPLSGNTVAAEMSFDRPELYIAVKRIIESEKNAPFIREQHEKAKEVLRYIVEEGKK